MSTSLVRYDAMCRAIAEAHAIDEVKDIRDKALALEAYARQALNTDAEREACEIRLRAERKVGQLLRDGEKNKGARGTGSNQYQEVRSTDTTTPPLTLKQLGISKDQSSQWQKLGAMPDDDFELAIGTKTSMPSTNGILRTTAQPEGIVVSTDALRLWGRLRDFTTDEWLAKSPTEVMETMTPEMKDDVHRLAPRFAAWLKRIGGRS
jgi:hypothetical protein